MYRVSVEVVLKWGKVCWDAERCGDVGVPTHSSTPFLHLSPHTLHTHPTPISTFTQHLPHSPDTSFHTFPHFPTPLTFSPHLSSPPLTFTFPSPFPTLPHAHSPYFITTPQFPPTLPILYHLPHTKISLFSRLLPN